MNQPTEKVLQKEDTKDQHQTNQENKECNAYFIPGMIPKSTINIKNYDVEIFEPRILTINNKHVNMLKMDESYIYTFKVK